MIKNDILLSLNILYYCEFVFLKKKIHTLNVYNTFLVKKKLYRLLSKFRKNSVLRKITLFEKIKKDNVFLDFGANKGYYTSLFSS